MKSTRAPTLGSAENKKSYPKFRVSFLFSASSVKRKMSSMISTLERSIRLQQYLLMPKLSNTSLAFSPVRILRANSSHLSPISLPQVKHLTGIIIFVCSPTGNSSVPWLLHRHRRISSIPCFVRRLQPWFGHIQ
jgi:hypothetical protein